MFNAKLYSVKALKSSPDVDIKNLWSSTSLHKNVLYDVFKTTDVIKDFYANQEHKLCYNLIFQGFFFKHMTNDFLPKLNSIWSSM